MDKIKNICEKNKYTMCIFIGMLIFTTVICTNFIKTHFALDTYCVYSYDSQELISHFLLSNRIVSALARWIFDVLRIPLLVNMKILSIIGILFLATAWFILYKFIIRISNKQNNIFYNILIIGISFIIIYNFCSVECLAFWESGIICFGILCTVIAACLFNSNIKYNKLITFIFLLLASICYQGAITLFIPLALVFLAYKNKEINKENIKRFKKAVIVEGEKSVLKADTYFKGKSCVVATCGFNVSDWQIRALEKLGVDTVYLGFDKDFDDKYEEVYKADKLLYDNYLRYNERLRTLAQRLALSFNVFLIKDTKGLLDIKDSPFDKGKDVYNQLIKMAKPVYSYGERQSSTSIFLRGN
mgnify:CR=1 FL=1